MTMSGFHRLMKTQFSQRFMVGFSEHVGASARRYTVNPKKLETGLRPKSAGIPYALLLRIEAIGFPTFGLLL